MEISTKSEISEQEKTELLTTLKTRFEKNRNRHPDLEWQPIEAKLNSNPRKLMALFQMEETGGESDVVEFDQSSGEYIFYDCAAESPKGRRSLCYDKEALDSRKEFKPAHSVIDMASSMGVEVLTKDQYHELQSLGKFDTKTSSWVKTPEDIRKLGGAIFCDYRYGTIFTYHNGAESYYAGRGFRGSLRV